jgi:hypothetical protein
VSYDLHVYSKRQPRAADLDAFLGTAEHAPSTDGHLKRDGHLLLADAHGVHTELDGPSRAEAEDLPDAATGAIGRTGWLVQLSVKPSADVAWPMDLASHLARVADGVVYDPQEDRVTWPTGFRPRDPASGEERITEVELTWVSMLPGSDATVPRRFLAALRANAPEALPKRYGDIEPLPYRLEGPRGEADFVARWQEVAATFLPMLFFTATRPCFGGSAVMSTTHDPEPPRPGKPIVRISLSFDGRAFARDPQLTERMIGLFIELATTLSCVYAAGAVQRDMILKRGRSSFDARTESTPIPHADRWMGLPAAPTWLAWFGRPYADLVRSTVAPFIREERDGGLLVRLSDDPADRDRLADIFPPLPLELVARRQGKPPSWERDVRYSFLGGPPSHPAEIIPLPGP